MAVEKDVTRKAVTITWDTSEVTGETVKIKATNPDSGDVSDAVGKNDGVHALTYPTDYHGKTDVVVTGSDGGEDTGTIEV